jgi:SAM-dependent methyltransferase
MTEYKINNSMSPRDWKVVKEWVPSGDLWYLEAVGGKWGIHGPLQLGFLKKQGMKPEHYMLDIGCGSLRGGVQFIKYLQPGHYHGIDHDPEMLRVAREIVIPRYGLEDQKPHLRIVKDFEVEGRIRQAGYNFMLAQSVFTHLNPGEIEKCLRVMKPYLRVLDGTLFATFNLSPNPGTIRCNVPYPIMTSYPKKWFFEVCEEIGLTCQFIGGWGHPSNKANRQLMLSFR